jgi:16S rRNA processing protein RimM
VAGATPPVAPAAELPPDLVELGAVQGAYGVKGWVRVSLLGSDGTVLLTVADWWVVKAGRVWQLTPQERRRHAGLLLAKWPGCESKEDAEALKGAVIAVPRSAFPEAPAGEYYWADLLGCRVVNRTGDELGTVSGLRENAGGQWLEVSNGPAGEVLLIPLVEQYVEVVDPSARFVRVDWQRDW